MAATSRDRDIRPGPLVSKDKTGSFLSGFSFTHSIYVMEMKVCNDTYRVTCVWTWDVPLHGSTHLFRLPAGAWLQGLLHQGDALSPFSEQVPVPAVLRAVCRVLFLIHVTCVSHNTPWPLFLCMRGKFSS